MHNKAALLYIRYAHSVVHLNPWVTKAKRNTALYRKIQQPGRHDRFVPVSPWQLIVESYKRLTSGSGLSTVAVDGIYMNLPYEILGRKGQMVTKNRFVPITTVAAIRMKEEETKDDHASTEEDPAPTKGRIYSLATAVMRLAKRSPSMENGGGLRFSFARPNRSLALKNVIRLRKHIKSLI